MIKKLTKHGDDLALVIDRSMLERLGIDETTALEVSTNGQAIAVWKASDAEARARFETALAEGNQLYAEALKRLAE